MYIIREKLQKRVANHRIIIIFLSLFFGNRMHHHRAKKEIKSRLVDLSIFRFFKSFSLCHIFLGQVHHHDFSKVFLLFAVRQGLNGSQAIDYISGFAEIDLV